MFNIQHIIYMVVSTLLTVALLIFCAVKVKGEKGKNLILKISAWATVFIHYSDIWVNFFATGGNATVESVYILPVYPCNVMMWLLLACVFVNKKSVLFKLLTEFCFYGGIVCGVIGIALNANFDSNPTLANYGVLKGLLSHSTMLFGCIYLKTTGFVKIRVFNVVSVTCGLLTFVLCGCFVNGLYERFGMTPPDGIFLNSNPYFNLSPILLGAIALVFLFIALAVYELTFPKEERWYNKMKRSLLKEENTSEKFV